MAYTNNAAESTNIDPSFPSKQQLREAEALKHAERRMEWEQSRELRQQGAVSVAARALKARMAAGSDVLDGGEFARRQEAKRAEEDKQREIEAQRLAEHSAQIEAIRQAAEDEVEAARRRSSAKDIMDKVSAGPLLDVQMVDHDFTRSGEAAEIDEGRLGEVLRMMAINLRRSERSREKMAQEYAEVVDAVVAVSGKLKESREEAKALAMRVEALERQAAEAEKFMEAMRSAFAPALARSSSSVNDSAGS